MAIKWCLYNQPPPRSGNQTLPVPGSSPSLLMLRLPHPRSPLSPQRKPPSLLLWGSLLAFPPLRASWNTWCSFALLGLYIQGLKLHISWCLYWFTASCGKLSLGLMDLKLKTGQTGVRTDHLSMHSGFDPFWDVDHVSHVILCHLSVTLGTCLRSSLHPCSLGRCLMVFWEVCGCG